MPFVRASDGVLLHYTAVGAGRPIVLVHGWTMNGRFFDKNIAALAENHQVITIDSRGHGLSGKDLIHLTMPQVGRDVETVLAEIDVREGVLAGWSMGMATVYNYLAQYGTERLAGIVDIDMTPYLFAEDDWEHGVFGNLTPRSSLEVQAQMIADRETLGTTLIPAMFAAGSTQSPEDLAWWAEQSLMVPDLIAMSLWVSFSNQDWRPLLPEIDVPVLLAHGRKSQIYPTPVWEALERQIPQTHTHIFEDSGHSPFWEEPEEFNRAVLGFVDGL
ncbi:MAG: alpha/beta hydrolase [Nocardioides sp.]|uniref:alpha/beta fold hydrolase n=1 Tax=Nocardioides sp. TaxID=35761 RepID=UPI0039E6A86C